MLCAYSLFTKATVNSPDGGSRLIINLLIKGWLQEDDVNSQGGKKQASPALVLIPRGLFNWLAEL